MFQTFCQKLQLSYLEDSRENQYQSELLFKHLVMVKIDSWNQPRQY